MRAGDVVEAGARGGAVGAVEAGGAGDGAVVSLQDTDVCFSGTEPVSDLLHFTTGDVISAITAFV